MKDKLAKGVAWLGAAKVIVNLLALGSTLILARLLTPEDFGLFSLALTMLTIISALTELSMANALIHHKSPTDIHFNTAWTLNLSRALIIGIIFSISAPIMAQIYHEPRLTSIMLFLAVSIVMSGLNNPKMVLLTRDLVFWQEFALTVSQKFAGFIVGVAIALIYKSYWALVGGMIASQFVGIVISYIIIPFKPKFSFAHSKELWSFSIWLTFGQIVNTLNWKLDHLLIGSYLGVKSLGFYSVGDNLAGLPTRETIGPLQTTLFPGFKKISDDNERLKAAYKSAQSLITAIVLPIGVGFALIAHPMVLLVMGEKWLPIVQVIQVLSCVFALQTLSSPVQPLAMSKGETKLLFKRDLFSFGMRVPIIVAGMFMGGLLGIIYARAITGVIAIFINMHLVRRLIGTAISSQIAANGRSLISILLMAICVLYLESILGQGGAQLDLLFKIVALIIFGALIYLSTHFILWIIAGRPQGPENEILKIVFKLIEKIRRVSNA
ncbi:MAG: lipopolysaccharide biosynthesis protein [Methylotenera sp.]|uniref:lipopolysaccharide biosynthesis protein n=1 Tax=Methylotenera sp. TaxID=2051956 RepID=UPI00248A5ED5|nr:lipopolysaccharide biosynthesis protein [Methylotenera sp.]MDI1309667.1 lipopolysaccharide biosynthesis protein [Methylotenera sp.]